MSATHSSASAATGRLGRSLGGRGADEEGQSTGRSPHPTDRSSPRKPGAALSQPRPTPAVSERSDRDNPRVSAPSRQKRKLAPCGPRTPFRSAIPLAADTSRRRPSPRLHPTTHPAPGSTAEPPRHTQDVCCPRPSFHEAREVVADRQVADRQVPLNRFWAIAAKIARVIRSRAPPQKPTCTTAHRDTFDLHQQAKERSDTG
jgi:hypothetical protein